MTLTCVALPDSRYQTKTLPRWVDITSVKSDGISFLVLEEKSLIQIQHSNCSLFLWPRVYTNLFLHGENEWNFLSLNLYVLQILVRETMSIRA